MGQIHHKHDETGSFLCAILLPQTRLAGLVLAELEGLSERLDLNDGRSTPRTRLRTSAREVLVTFFLFRFVFPNITHEKHLC